MIVIFHDTFFLSLREMTVALNSYVIYLLHLAVYVYLCFVWESGNTCVREALGMWQLLKK